MTSKKTIVIGGSSGIGLATAHLLYSLGHDIVIASRSAEKLSQAVQSIGAVDSYPLDMTCEESLENFFKTIGPFDHLVISAADFCIGPFLEMPLESSQNFFNSKFWGQYLAAKHGASSIRPRGSITFFAGVASQKPFMHFAVGAAINAAIEGLTRALALELSPLRVNAIAPGTVVTPVWNSLPEKERNRAFEEEAKRLPIQRVGYPEDIAKAVQYLIECEYATGSIVYVDGGKRII